MWFVRAERALAEDAVGSTSPCAKGFSRTVHRGRIRGYSRQADRVRRGDASASSPIRDVETAIPAFIGATQKASTAVDRVNAVDPAGSANTDLLLKPTLIRSMRDFEEFFGDAGAIGATVHVTENAGVHRDRVDDPTTHLPALLRGQAVLRQRGQRCYVVSVGTRTALAPAPTLASLTKWRRPPSRPEEDPTLIVVPEAVSLPRADYATLAASIIAQCARRRDRFAILTCSTARNPTVDVAPRVPRFPRRATCSSPRSITRSCGRR
jgi:phage tail sheath protein FI